MRIATRLVLILGALVVTIMVIYAIISQRQREALLRAAVVRETETLAHALQIVTNNALRDGRFRDLNRVLGEVVEVPETFIGAVVDPEGRVLAGGASHYPACIGPVLSNLDGGMQEKQGWTTCDGEPVQWIVLPVRPPGSALVLARRATVLTREVATARVRLAMLTLVLASTAALAVLLVLRRTLSAPLAEILRGIRTLGEPGPPQLLRVPASAGELAHLARSFNDMAQELETRRSSLLREAEERIALERRLGETEKFAAIGRLSGGLAHELGSPLSVIGMRAEAIQSSADVSPVLRRHAGRIADEVERISQLVQGLLHAGRRQGVTREPFDLVEVIRGALDHIHPQLQVTDTELQLQLPQHPVLVRGQATLLRHALLNLLRNAVQALAGYRGDRCLRVEVNEGADSVHVVVEDSGPGIAEEHLAHIFEPFYTTKEVGEGTGLGLAISYGIIEEHGGKLRVEPREGGGVRASVSLPKASPPIHTPESP